MSVCMRNLTYADPTLPSATWARHFSREREGAWASRSPKRSRGLVQIPVIGDQEIHRPHRGDLARAARGDGLAI